MFLKFNSNPFFFALISIGILFQNNEVHGLVNYSTNLTSDKHALNYCKNTSNSYVAIVWPRGYKHLDYIIKTLNEFGSVKYVKKFVLSNDGPFILYHHLHKMSLPTAEKYFKHYLPVHPIASWKFVAIAFTTDEALPEIINWKKKIRVHIGCGHQSIHINDTYKETLEAAELIFNDSVLKQLNTLPRNFSFKK